MIPEVLITRGVALSLSFTMHGALQTISAYTVRSVKTINLTITSNGIRDSIKNTGKSNLRISASEV